MATLIRTDNNEFVVTYAEDTKAKVFEDGNDATGFFHKCMEEEAKANRKANEPTKEELRREKLQDEYLEDLANEQDPNAEEEEE